MENARTTLPDKIIEGSLAVAGAAEAVHLAGLFLGLPFHVCAAVLTALLLCAVLCAVGIRMLRRKRKGPEKEKIAPYRALFRNHPGWLLLLFLLVVFQMVWYYWAHIPCIKNDITGETVQTILTTDRLYEINPLTGRPFSNGMPMRLKILVLPTLSAFLCRLTGLPVMTVCYSVVPCIVIALSYVVYLDWAAYLFPGERKKRFFFLFFMILLYQFGTYSLPLDGYTLLFGGYQGEAVRTGILLPYALLCCLRGRKRGLLLCLLAEVCVVWTFYGLGYVAVAAVFYGAVRLYSRWADRRRAAW